MSAEIISALDVATGAVVASTIEPNTGGGSISDKACLNCGTALAGRFCASCGQKAQVHRTLRSFGHDILHGVLHFDGKIWRTLPMLLWNPGHLTRRYIHGERAKFVSPLALFLFTVFLTFAVFSSVIGHDTSGIKTKTMADMSKQYDDNVKRKQASLAKLQQSLAKETDAQDKVDLAKDITKLNTEITTLIKSNAIILEKIRQGQADFESAKTAIDREIIQLKAQAAEAKKAGNDISDIEDNIEGEEFARSMLIKGHDAVNDPSVLYSIQSATLFSDNPTLNNIIKHAFDNPKLLVYRMQSSAYKFSWALIPISVPFVWLLFFWKRRFKLFDHAIFVTYSLTFMMLIAALCTILLQFSAMETAGGLIMSFVPPVHMYRQLHQAYETSRFGAFWRMCILIFFAVTALCLFGLFIVALGIAG